MPAKICMKFKASEPHEVFFWLDRELNYKFEDYDIEYDITMEEFGEKQTAVLSTLRHIMRFPNDFFFRKGQLTIQQYEAVVCGVLIGIIEYAIKEIPDYMSTGRKTLFKIKEISIELREYWKGSCFNKRQGFSKFGQYIDFIKSETRHSSEQFFVISYWNHCVDEIIRAIVFLMNEPSRLLSFGGPILGIHEESQIENLNDLLKRRTSRIATAISMSELVIRNNVWAGNMFSGDPLDFIETAIPWEEKQSYGAAIRKADLRKVIGMAIDSVGELQELGLINRPILIKV